MQFSSELSDTWNIHPARSLILAICTFIMLSILGVILFSAAGNYTATPAAYRASVHVDAGTVYVLKASTGDLLRLNAGDTLLLDVEDKVAAHEGKAIITFFDGSTRALSGTTYVFDKTSSSLNSTGRLKLHWLLRMWTTSPTHAQPINSAASVLG